MEQLQYEIRGKAPWTRDEDGKLRDYVHTHGAHHWDTMARNLDIGRSGNSCRLRWFNYLSPNIRRGEFSNEEILMILQLHHELGNRWSKIAEELPGRTDNDIKNFWNTQLKKEAKQLNCDVESEEFLRIMTAKLTGRNFIGSGGDTMVSSLTGSSHAADSGNYSWSADEELSHHHGSIADEFWSNLGPICHLDYEHKFRLDG